MARVAWSGRRQQEFSGRRALRTRPSRPCLCLRDEDMARVNESEGLERGSAAAFELEEPEEPERGRGVDQADRDLGYDQVGHAGEGRAGGDVARRLDAVRERDRARDGLEPA